jgi:hypothetical protein
MRELTSFILEYTGYGLPKRYNHNTSGSEVVYELLWLQVTI